MTSPITVETVVNAPIEKIWSYWNEPEHVTKWNNASDDWHTTRATNDLKVGGRFNIRMEAKDGSQGFDLIGTYTAIEQNKRMEYTLEDGRKVIVEFKPEGKGYRIVETFEPENVNSVEVQKGGWQTILDNFKKYVEGA